MQRVLFDKKLEVKVGSNCSWEKYKGRDRDSSGKIARGKTQISAVEFVRKSS